MEAKEALTWLNSRSETHRNQFNERRKCEYKVLLALLTFYAVCAASSFTGKVDIPDSIILKGFIGLALLSSFVLAAYFFRDLHSANNINKLIAEKAEDGIIQILRKENNIGEVLAGLQPDESGKQDLQITFGDIFKILKPNKRRGLWACRMQIFTILLFAAVGAFGLIIFNPKTNLQQPMLATGIARPETQTGYNIILGACTVIIGIIALWVGWQHVRTSRQNVRLGLFDKRYRVYDGVMRLLAVIAQRNDVDDDQMREFYIATDQSLFLFERDILDYLEEIRKKARDLQDFEKLRRDPELSPQERSDRVDKSRSVSDWFKNQLGDAKKKFMKDLDFRKL